MRDQRKTYDPADSIAGTVIDVDTMPSAIVSVAPDDDLVGHIFIGRYQIEKLLASGTMGRVYLGTQLRLERPVAIKILKSFGSGVDPRFAKRFCREASIAAQVAHPNIVSIYDYGETDDGQLFMVMEYLEGRQLHEMIREEAPFSVERALEIAIQMARALRKAHAASVVHRDLKPANVIVKTDEEGFDFVKVLDFGLVKLFAPEESPVSSPFDDDHLTRPGNMVGTPDYVSPEQALGDEVDGRTDVYSLGVILFQMIAGRLPYIGGSIIEMVKHHLHSPIPRIADVAPHVECPEEVEAIIHRAMQKVRDDRYTSMDQLLVDLKAAWRNITDESFGTESFSVNPAEVVAEPREMMLVTRRMVVDPSEESRPAGNDQGVPHPSRRSLPTYLAFGAAALLGIAGVSGAFFFTSLDRPPPTVIVPVEPIKTVEAALPLPVPEEVVTAEAPVEEPEKVEAAAKPVPVRKASKRAKPSKKQSDYKDNPF